MSGNCRHVGAVGLLALAVAVPLVLLSPRDTSFLRSLDQMASVSHSDGAGVLRHLASRRPFIVRGGVDPSWTSRLMDECGDLRAPFPPLMSGPTMLVLDDINQTHGSSSRPVQWMIEQFLGATPDDYLIEIFGPKTLRAAWLALRKSEERSSPTRLARLIGLILPGSAAAHAAEAMGSVAASPLYISNMPPFCPLLKTLPPPAWMAAAVAELERACGDVTSRDTRKANHMADPRFFLGGQGSLSYPLHVDDVDGDVVIAVVAGGKEVVVLADDPTDSVQAMRIAGTSAYGIDVFDHSAVPGVTGWTSQVEAGDSVVIPGGLPWPTDATRHAVKNIANETISLCWRPWKASSLQRCMDRGDFTGA